MINVTRGNKTEWKEDNFVLCEGLSCTLHTGLWAQPESCGKLTYLVRRRTPNGQRHQVRFPLGFDTSMTTCSEPKSRASWTVGSGSNSLLYLCNLGRVNPVSLNLSSQSKRGRLDGCSKESTEYRPWRERHARGRAESRLVWGLGSGHRAAPPSADARPSFPRASETLQGLWQSEQFELCCHEGSGVYSLL